jgi:tryptophan synthase alpha chain
MNRIAQQFKNGPAYVAYLTAGDGGMQRSLEAMLALIAGGVNILEVGVPFSDPVADGPIIQQAAARALTQGTTLAKVFNLITQLRQHTEIPIILFSYYNPILAYGENFYRDAKQAGIDGCLIVDLPLEESAQYFQACSTFNIDPILLIAPSTPLERVKQINQCAKGFLYYVSRKGTTGIKSSLPEDFTSKITAIKSVITLPVVVGFGIANCETAKAVMKHADGFVIGSLFVDAVGKNIDAPELTQLANSIDPFSQRKALGESGA